MYERTGARGAPVHWAKDLDVADGIEPEALRDAGLDQFDDPGGRGLRILGRHEVEVAVACGSGEIGNGAPVDAVRAGDDPALRRLAEHLGQAHHGDCTGGDDVRKHLSRPHRGQLVDIADDQQRGPAGHQGCPGGSVSTTPQSSIAFRNSPCQAKSARSNTVSLPKAPSNTATKAWPVNRNREQETVGLRYTAVTGGQHGAARRMITVVGHSARCADAQVDQDNRFHRADRHLQPGLRPPSATVPADADARSGCAPWFPRMRYAPLRQRRLPHTSRDSSV